MLQRWKQRLSSNKQHARSKKEGSLGISRSVSSATGKLAVNLAKKAIVEPQKVYAGKDACAMVSDYVHALNDGSVQHTSSLSTPTLASGISSASDSRETQSFRQQSARASSLEGIADPASLHFLHDASAPDPLKTSNKELSGNRDVRHPISPSYQRSSLDDNMFAELMIPSISIPKPAVLDHQRHRAPPITERSFAHDEQASHFSHQKAVQGVLVPAKVENLEDLKSGSPQSEGQPTSRQHSVHALADTADQDISPTEAAAPTEVCYDGVFPHDDLSRPQHRLSQNSNCSSPRTTFVEYNNLLTAKPTEIDAYVDREQHKDDLEIASDYLCHLEGIREQDALATAPSQSLPDSQSNVGFMPRRKSKLAQSVDWQSLDEALSEPTRDQRLPVGQVAQISRNSIQNISFKTGDPAAQGRSASTFIATQNTLDSPNQARNRSSSSLISFCQQSSKSSLKQEFTGGTLLEQAAWRQARRKAFVRESNSKMMSSRPTASILQHSTQGSGTERSLVSIGTSFRSFDDNSRASQKPFCAETQTSNQLSSKLKYYEAIQQEALRKARDAEACLAALRLEMHTPKLVRPTSTTSLHNLRSKKSNRCDTNVPHAMSQRSQPAIWNSALSTTERFLSSRYRSLMHTSRTSSCHAQHERESCVQKLPGSLTRPAESRQTDAEVSTKVFRDEELWQHLAQEKRRHGKSPQGSISRATTHFRSNIPARAC